MSESVTTARPSLIRVLLDPAGEMERIRENPVFWWPLLLVTLVGAALLGLTMHFAVQDPAVWSQLTEQTQGAGIDSEKLKTYMVWAAAGSMVLSYPVVLLIGAFVLWVFVSLFQGEATYRQLFSLQVHLGIFTLLASLVNLAGTALFGLNPTVPVTSVGSLVEAEGMLAGFLNSVEVFTIWSTAVLAIGLRKVAGLSNGKAWTVAVLMWFLGTLMSAVGALFGP